MWFLKQHRTGPSLAAALPRSGWEQPGAFPTRARSHFYRSGFLRLLALLVFAGAPLRADVKVGDPFPSLADAGLVTLAGGALPATGGKVLLIDFWASWCAPCKASFPMMSSLQRDYAARGLVIAAVGVDEKIGAAEAFVRKLAPAFPTLHDRTHRLAQQVAVPAMPTSYLVGRDGRVRHVHPGFHGTRTERELRRQIEALLAEPH